MKKITKLTALSLVTVIGLQTVSLAEFEWAKDAVTYCVDNKILTGMEDGNLALGDNITREQMAKILVDAFGLKSTENKTFSDVLTDRWSYLYIQAFKDCMKKTSKRFKPEKTVTREEFASSLMLAAGLSENDLKNPNILLENFDDGEYVDEDYADLLAVAVERGYLMGSDGFLRPDDLLTRAEACSLLYRVMSENEDSSELELGVKESTTQLVGEPQVTLEQAKAWATKMHAEQRYIDIADIYWKYGEITGIRPEVLYAQAAKETGFGRYSGAVKPEQNNWAGIKTKDASGDRTEDHETFASPDDGVRAHFNHMSAYIGLEPVGEPHARYFLVKTIAWAGTVKTVEELGGKWCPDKYYGYSILHDYIEKMY